MKQKSGKKTGAKKGLLVGITGGIGAGKSAVAALYREQGFSVFSADEIAREVVAPGSPALEEIAKLFGKDSLASDGTLNRAYLRDQIANDPNLRLKLEAITHPRIQDRSLALATEAMEKGAKVVFYEAPLLFEAKSDKKMASVICVHAKDELRLQRVMERDSCSRDQAMKLLLSQMPQEEKVRRSDYLVENNGDKKGLEKNALEVLKQILEKATG